MGIARKNYESRLRTVLVSVLLMLPFFLLCSGIVALYLLVLPLKLTVGQIVPFTIVSPAKAVYIDSAALNRLTREGKAYIIDPRVEEDVLLALRSFFGQIRREQAVGKSAGEISAVLGKEYGVPEEVVALLLTFDEQALRAVESYASKEISAIMQSVVDEERLSAFQQSVQQNASVNLPEKIALSFLRVNIKESAEPKEVREYLLGLVSHPIEKGEIILNEGGAVNQLVLDKLEAVKSQLQRQRLLQFIGVVLLLAAVCLVWLAHVSFFKKELLKKPSVWLELSFVALLGFFLSLLVSRLPFPYIYYGIPVGLSLASIVIVTVYDAILGLYVGIGLSLIVSLTVGLSGSLSAYVLLSAIYAVAFLGRKSTPRSLVLFGLNLGAFNVILALIIILVSIHTFSWWALLYSFLSGFGSSILALGLIPAIDLLSVQATPTKLSALLSQEHPLLKRLLSEAPGTYFHSLIMSSMTEDACRLIGANALLGKVGAMYHDIGKLKRPGFFAENITEPSRNPHQNLPPESSCQIVVHHVSEGIDLATKARLPAEVIAFIPEHHGKDVVRYFYEEALRRKNQGLEIEVSEDDFRYPGPNPRSKETAIVMLADSCEALIRSKESFDEFEVKQIITNVIEQKLRQGLLDDSGLTAGDFNKIIEAFASVLVNVHHARLKYPAETQSSTRAAIKEGHL